MTYRVSALPAAWYPTDMETGIRQVVRQLSRTFDTARPG
jgi:hypothetical protein